MKHPHVKITRKAVMVDPFRGRRAKVSHSIERSGFARGGGVPSDIAPLSSAAPRKAKKRAFGGRSVGKHGGTKAIGRLDRVARGIQKRQAGGPVLPTQAAPRASQAVAAPQAAAPATGAPWAGQSLPPTASPQANAYGLLGTSPTQGAPAAAAAGPAVNPTAWGTAPGLSQFGGSPPGLAHPGGMFPPQAAAGSRWSGGAGFLGQAGGARPFKRGGRTGDVKDGYLTGKGGPYSSAYVGKKK